MLTVSLGFNNNNKGNAMLLCFSYTAENLPTLSSLFLQSPPKGATIPYRPKPASTPVIFSGGQVRAELALAC